MTTLSQRSFAAGEVSPALYARVDTVKYATGLKTCRNGFIMRHGGVSSRAGTAFVGEVKDSSKITRLLPFEFSDTQTYVLEFGHQVVRFIQKGGYITSGGSVYEVATPYADTDIFALKIVQSLDVVTIVHPSYEPRKLSRLGAANWAITTYTFAPTISAPSGVSVSKGVNGSTTYSYKVTAIASETKEESLPSSYGYVSSAGVPTTSSPHTVYWNSVADAEEYNIYRELNGVYGFIGIAVGTSFKDVGTDPDISDTPPSSRNPFSGAGNYPSTVTYVQQRLAFANTENKTATVELSRTGMFTNFTRSNPIQADDGVSFTMEGRMNRIEHLVDLGGLIVLTSGGEWAVKGGEGGMITPTSINMQKASYNGASSLTPIVVSGTLLFVQSGGSVVRDLVFDYQVDGYRGNELSIYSSHLVDGYKIVDWCYQKLPHNIVWMVRDDGVLLSMTYVREQEIIGWAKHDFHGGIVESVTAVRENNQEAVYVLVRRVVNGQKVRYVERMTQRKLSSPVDDIIDFVGMDCSLTYDGRNTDNTHTMTISGGTTWGHEESITLTSSSAFFDSADIGNEIHASNTNGDLIRLKITEFTSDTVVTVRPQKVVPESMRATAISSWAKAVDQVGGLGHLAGEKVSIFADRLVVANPNNASYTTLTVNVQDNTVTLDTAYTVIHVGLPITVDIETLDIEVFQAETMANKKKNVDSVTMMVESTRGIFAGSKAPTSDDDLSELIEFSPRDTESYDDPPSLKTEAIKIVVPHGWSKGGRVFVRQSDPVPLTLLSVAVSGLIPVKG